MSTNFDYTKACQAMDTIETFTNKIVPEAFQNGADFMNAERNENGSGVTDEIFKCFITAQNEYNDKVVPAIKVLLGNANATGEMAKMMEAYTADKIAETERKDAEEIDLSSLKGLGI